MRQKYILIVGFAYAGTNSVATILEEMLGKDRTARVSFSDPRMELELAKARNKSVAYVLLVNPHQLSHFNIQPPPDLILYIHASDDIRYERYNLCRFGHAESSVAVPLWFLEQDKEVETLIHNFTLEHQLVLIENNHRTIEPLQKRIAGLSYQISYQPRHSSAA
jgi:hypothetical protein